MHKRYPKGYLSASSIDLFKKSIKAFRDRYYFGKEPFVTKEMIFGKKIHKQIENGEIDIVPKYSKSEFPLFGLIDGIPIYAIFDTIEPFMWDIRDYKTGKTPWDQDRVNNSLQLNLYWLLIKDTYKVEPKIHLDWIETEDSEEGIRLTGNVKSFEFEMKAEQYWRDQIYFAAQKIEQDYQDFLINQI